MSHTLLALSCVTKFTGLSEHNYVNSPITLDGSESDSSYICMYHH